MDTMKLNIICIDDDEFMLKAIARLVRRLRPTWNTMFTTDPLIWRNQWDNAQEPPAIFISDLIMPRKRGDELLSEIKDVFPDAIRVLLTGGANHSLPERALSYAHFVLPKPFTEDDFEHLFQCAERLHKMPFNKACRRKLGTFLDLPLLPNTVMKLQRVISSPNCDIHAIAEVASHEPALVARLFQVANSPYFGFRRHTDSLPEAVGRLGATLVETIAITQLSRIKHKCLSVQKHKAIAENALRVGAISRMLARQLGLTLTEQDKVFVASLLSSIGALVLLEEGATEQELSHFIGLQEGFHDDHVVAAYVLIMWGYDIDIGDMILNQDNMIFDENDGVMTCSGVVGLAAKIAAAKTEFQIEALLLPLPASVASLVSELIPILLEQ
jgi:HD-like signal output (HDOD) protein/ActR/RegA family two-component response regulator